MCPILTREVHQKVSSIVEKIQRELVPFKQGGVCVTLWALAIYTLKSIFLRHKDDCYENSNISPLQKIYNLQKNPLKETKVFSRHYYNSVINLKFQHNPKKKKKNQLSKILI
jgi:hypothetical protein